MLQVIEPQIIMDDYEGGDEEEDDSHQEDVVVNHSAEADTVAAVVKTEQVNGVNGGEEEAFLDVCPICQDVRATKQHLMSHLMPELVEAFQGLTSCPEPDCETLDYYQVLTVTP